MTRSILVAAVLLAAVATLHAGESDVFVRPVPDAGPASTTLVVYDTLAKPFSLVNEVAVVTTLLARFQTRVEARQADAVNGRDVEAADYLILVGVAGVPRLAAPAQAAIEKSSKPVFAVGWASIPGADVSSVRSQSLTNARVSYAGIEWKAVLDPFVEVGRASRPSLAEVVSPSPRRVLAWREGRRFAFAALPTPGAASLILSDLLLDFYGVEEPAPAALVYLVQDFHPGSDARAFRRLVDYFAARDDRFAVSVRLKPPLADTVVMEDDAFFEALRYAQAHGGRIVLRPEVGGSDVKSLVQAGLVPLACELPSGGTRPARPLPGIGYGTALGKIEAPGPKGTAQAVSASSVMGGEESTLVIPLNIDPGLASTAERGIAAEVRELSRLRGTMAGVVIPAWHPFQKMRDAVDAARQSGLRGADLATAPNWIKTAEAIITGSQVRRGFSLPGGTAAERVAFDRNFRRMGQGEKLPQGEAAAATALLLHRE